MLGQSLNAHIRVGESSTLKAEHIKSMFDGEGWLAETKKFKLSTLLVYFEYCGAHPFFLNECCSS